MDEDTATVLVSLPTEWLFICRLGTKKKHIRISIFMSSLPRYRKFSTLKRSSISTPSSKSFLSLHLAWTRDVHLSSFVPRYFRIWWMRIDRSQENRLTRLRSFTLGTRVGSERIKNMKSVWPSSDKIGR